MWIYNLSDRETEFQICNRLSFRKFLGLGIEDNVPDATTIENFMQIEDMHHQEK